MNNSTYSVLIADDHAIIRIGLRLLLHNMNGSFHIEDADGGETVIGKLKNGHFDLLILDINMRQTESLSLVGYLRTEFPALKILIFTVNEEVSLAMRFLRMGVHGYLFKVTDEAEIRTAVSRIREGHVYLGESLAGTITEELINPGPGNPFETLSDRELEVTMEILKGYSLNEIAKTLHLNRSTVGTHKSRVMKKLGLTNTIELINLARAHKLV